MRTSTFSTSTLVLLFVLGVLAGPARAEHRRASPDGRDGRVAAAPRTDASLATGTTGAIAITGASAIRGVSGVAGRELRAATSPAARDLAASPRPARKQAHLSASDVAALVAPHGPAIERCYLDAVGGVRRTAQLDLMFVIAHQGNLLSVDIGAPSASPQAVDAMVRCIRSAVADLQFPARRNDTTAIIPYVFQRTEAPDAGPQLSCWNPKGC